MYTNLDGKKKNQEKEKAERMHAGEIYIYKEMKKESDLFLKS